MRMQRGVGCVAWSGDGKRLASGGNDRTVPMCDMETSVFVVETLREDLDEEELASSSDGDVWVQCIACSRGGKRFALGWSDGMMRVLIGATGESVCKALRGHTRLILCVAMSADSKRVVSG